MEEGLERRKRKFLLNSRDMALIPYCLLVNPILGTKLTLFSALMWHIYGILAFDKYGIWNMGSIKDRTGMELIKGWERLTVLRSKHGVDFDVQLLIQMNKPEGSFEDFNEHLRQNLLKYNAILDHPDFCTCRHYRYDFVKKIINQTNKLRQFCRHIYKMHIFLTF